ncbi:hypothetical protein AX17_007526 [Amanita inopinata Kibby_2008]|nr:hypothetical protein AX17_007526 [Amanita inopinata Kibby_2008]
MLAAFRTIITRNLSQKHTLCRNVIAPSPKRIIPLCFYSTRNDREKLKSLTSSIHDFVEKVSDEGRINNFVHRELNKHLSQLSTPYVAYEKIISLLVDEKRLLSASTAYSRMLKSGFIPSVHIDGKMLAVAVALSPDDPRLPSAFDRIFMNPSFTEEHLLDMLEIAVDLSSTPKIVGGVVERFLERKEKGYTPGKMLLARLVDAQVRNGKLEEAFESLERFEDEVSVDSSVVHPHVPYVAIMAAIRDTKSSDSDAIDRALKIMKENNVQPDTAIMNVLIAREVRGKHLYNAFTIYAMLKKLSTKIKTVDPDDFTFGSLFSALSQIYNPKARRRMPCRRRDSNSPILSPRRLFFEMMSMYKSRASGSFELSASLLNVTLRTFIGRHDYAAAFIAIRCFRIYNQDVSIKTYFIVMKHIMDKIRWDIKRARLPGYSRWGDRFLGLRPYAGIDQLEVGKEMAEEVLAYGKRPVFRLLRPILNRGTKARPVEPPSTSSETRCRVYEAPTLKMMDEDEPVPPNMTFSSVPLERILRRAILADLINPRKGPVKDAADAKARAMLVSEAISEAKEKMVPSRAKKET